MNRSVDESLTTGSSDSYFSYLNQGDYATFASQSFDTIIKETKRGHSAQNLPGEEPASTTHDSYFDNLSILNSKNFNNGSNIHGMASTISINSSFGGMKTMIVSNSLNEEDNNVDYKENSALTQGINNNLNRVNRTFESDLSSHHFQKKGNYSGRDDELKSDNDDFDTLNDDVIHVTRLISDSDVIDTLDNQHSALSSHSRQRSLYVDEGEGEILAYSGFSSFQSSLIHDSASHSPGNDSKPVNSGQSLQGNEVNNSDLNLTGSTTPKRVGMTTGNEFNVTPKDERSVDSTLENFMLLSEDQSYRYQVTPKVKSYTDNDINEDEEGELHESMTLEIPTTRLLSSGSENEVDLMPKVVSRSSSSESKGMLQSPFSSSNEGQGMKSNSFANFAIDDPIKNSTEQSISNDSRDVLPLSTDKVQTELEMQNSGDKKDIFTDLHESDNSSLSYRSGNPLGTKNVNPSLVVNVNISNSKESSSNVFSSRFQRSPTSGIGDSSPKDVDFDLNSQKLQQKHAQGSDDNGSRDPNSGSLSPQSQHLQGVVKGNNNSQEFDSNVLSSRLQNLAVSDNGNNSPRDSGSNTLSPQSQHQHASGKVNDSPKNSDSITFSPHSLSLGRVNNSQGNLNYGNRPLETHQSPQLQQSPQQQNLSQMQQSPQQQYLSQLQQSSQMTVSRKGDRVSEDSNSNVLSPQSRNSPGSGRGNNSSRDFNPNILSPQSRNSHESGRSNNDPIDPNPNIISTLSQHSPETERNNTSQKAPNPDVHSQESQRSHESVRSKNNQNDPSSEALSPKSQHPFGSRRNNNSTNNHTFNILSPIQHSNRLPSHAMDLESKNSKSNTLSPAKLANNISSRIINHESDSYRDTSVSSSPMIVSDSLSLVNHGAYDSQNSNSNALASISPPSPNTGLHNTVSVSNMRNSAADISPSGLRKDLSSPNMNVNHNKTTDSDSKMLSPRLLVNNSSLIVNTRNSDSGNSNMFVSDALLNPLSSHNVKTSNSASKSSGNEMNMSTNQNSYSPTSYHEVNNPPLKTTEVKSVSSESHGTFERSPLDVLVSDQTSSSTKENFSQSPSEGVTTNKAVNLPLNTFSNSEVNTIPVTDDRTSYEDQNEAAASRSSADIKTPPGERGSQMFVNSPTTHQSISKDHIVNHLRTPIPNNNDHNAVTPITSHNNFRTPNAHESGQRQSFIDDEDNPIDNLSSKSAYSELSNISAQLNLISSLDSKRKISSPTSRPSNHGHVTKHTSTDTNHVPNSTSDSSNNSKGQVNPNRISPGTSEERSPNKSSVSFVSNRSESDIDELRDENMRLRREIELLRSREKSYNSELLLDALQRLSDSITSSLGRKLDTEMNVLIHDERNFTRIIDELCNLQRSYVGKLKDEVRHRRKSSKTDVRNISNKVMKHIDAYHIRLEETHKELMSLFKHTRY